MTYTPTRHDLPAALVLPDSPLSADVMGRTVEAIEYVWQVTTGTADADGGSLGGSPQGHTHDQINDQSLTADSTTFAGWPFGFGSPRLNPESILSPDPADPHFTPNGGWANGPATGAVGSIRSQFEVPFDAAGTNAGFMVFVLVEKGATLSAANAVQVQATVGGLAIAGASAAAAPGLELIMVGPWPPGSIPAGSSDVLVDITTALSGDYARLWHAVGVAA